MRLKRVYKLILSLVLILLIVIISIILYIKFSNYSKLKNDSVEINNKEPVYIDHMSEFDIKESHYIEEFYNRYIEYKKKHSEYTDDEIVTYVNIGLDNPFYTNMEEVNMGLGYLILCNKYHELKKDYVPDLVSLDGYGGGKMERVAAEKFKKMSDAAKKDGINIYNVSGYRSYNTQKDLYNGYVKRNGQTKADTFSARPGTSEHQTGLATDINSVSDSFANTKEYKWLINNSYKYGFILRYPKGKEHITGYKYEPWHFRYLGEEVAKFIYEKNITFEEYYANYLLKVKV